ncbi:uroporphyrinogen-III C-methyltransferase [Planctobacterium marinum]|uniref:Uroporphyrin-3 C-methyltransferase n=1 Tax=Planctobacterium marinum TaxID=1631968 RepID=A0AA48HCQ9_9ALTE|nr:hypothetical protein MACH26_01340 [Planctobacterium marinum]
MTDAKHNNDTSESKDDKPQAKAADKVEASAATDTEHSASSVGSSVHRKSQRKLNRTQKIEPTKTKRRTNPLIGFLVGLNTVIMLAAIAAGFWGWHYWQGWQEQQLVKHTEQEQALTQSLNTQLDNLARNLQIELSQRISTIKESEQRLNSEFRQLQEEVTQQLTGAEQDLDMAEVAYLVRMAARKLNVEKQVNSAIHLLQEADKQLAQQEDLNNTSLRERIAQDIRNLREFRPHDRFDKAFLIGGMLDKVPALKFPAPEQYFSSQSNEPSSDPADWWQNLKTLWHNLVDDFLTVEKLENPITPYLNQQEQLLTRNALSYDLLAMRHALLEADEALFKQLVEQSYSRMAQFEQSDISTQLMQKDLEQLMQMTFPKNGEMKLVSLEYLVNSGAGQ